MLCTHFHLLLKQALAAQQGSFQAILSWESLFMKHSTL